MPTFSSAELQACLGPAPWRIGAQAGLRLNWYKHKVRATYIFALATAACVSGCATDLYSFDPNAAWGEASATGGCPGGSPSIAVYALNPPWVRAEFGIWDSVQARNRRLTEPTVFIVVVKGWHLSIAEQERRVKTPITVRSENPFVDVTLSDGTQRRFVVPELAMDSVIVGQEWNWSVGKGKSFQVPLKEVTPQDLVIVFPDLIVNGETVKTGKVSFEYRKHTRWGGC